MHIATWVVIAGLSGCAVDEQTLSTAQEVGQGRLVDHFTLTGAGTSLLTSTEPGVPYVGHYLTTDEYIYDENLLFVQFGGLEQDPTSYVCGPEACYWAAGFWDYAYGVVPKNDSAVTATRGWIRTTVPANSDTFYSERCFYDRDGMRSCTSLEGMPIEIDWQAYGELEVSAGLQEFQFGDFVVRQTGRYTFTPSYANGILLDRQMTSVDGYITADRGNGVILEISHRL